jgi:hypothetical protein
MRRQVELQLQLIGEDLRLHDWMWQQYLSGARLIEISRRLSELTGLDVSSTKVREWMIK